MQKYEMDEETFNRKLEAAIKKKKMEKKQLEREKILKKLSLEGNEYAMAFVKRKKEKKREEKRKKKKEGRIG